MAKFQASINNLKVMNEVSLQVNDKRQVIQIPAKAEGYGSSVSGGELLCLALATCYCNDIYREAAKRGIVVENVEVDVDCEFEKDGHPAKFIGYKARVSAYASQDAIRELMVITNRMAEIQNTVRKGLPINLEN